MMAHLTTKIRVLDPDAKTEIELVATRMRQTLIEVLGKEKGESYYSLDWLIERVQWHLSEQKNHRAQVLLLELEDGHIAAHAMARLEKDELNHDYGYFSTLFIEPESRKLGLAKFLMDRVEQWFLDHKLNKFIYNTAENHHRLISIFQKRGYQITLHANEMVQLTKIVNSNLGGG